MEVLNTINLGHIITLALIAFGVITAWFNLRNSALNNTKEIEQVKAAIKMEKERIDLVNAKADTMRNILSEQLAEHREKTAQTYAPLTMITELRSEMKEMRSDMTELVGSINARLDKLLTRSRADG